MSLPSSHNHSAYNDGQPNKHSCNHNAGSRVPAADFLIEIIFPVDQVQRQVAQNTEHQPYHLVIYG